VTTTLKNTLTCLVIAGLALGVPLGCKDKEAEKPAPVEVLDAASNGSPISAKFVEFEGEGDDREMKVLVYNSGDKPAAAYFFLFRYYDANDKLLKVKVGTPFESDTDFTSMSGNKYKCEPKQNQTVEINARDAPADAVRAEILATQVRTVAADGNTIEDWWSQENFNEWPAG
jgi:hypothetical protein